MGEVNVDMKELKEMCVKLNESGILDENIDVEELKGDDLVEAFLDAVEAASEENEFAGPEEVATFYNELVDMMEGKEEGGEAGEAEPVEPKEEVAEAEEKTELEEVAEKVEKAEKSRPEPKAEKKAEKKEKKPKAESTKKSPSAESKDAVVRPSRFAVFADVFGSSSGPMSVDELVEKCNLTYIERGGKENRDQTAKNVQECLRVLTLFNVVETKNGKFSLRD